MGKPCVCGAEGLRIDGARRLIVAATVVEEGDQISIDGTTGAVYLGQIPVQPPPLVDYLDGRLDPDSAGADDLVRAVHRLLGHADARRRLGVRANADTPEDAARARRFGAEGIGLCRTEHMSLAIGASTSNTSCWLTRWPSGRRHSPLCSRCSGPTSWASSRPWPAFR